MVRVNNDAVDVIKLNERGPGALSLIMRMWEESNKLGISVKAKLICCSYFTPAVSMSPSKG